MRILFLSPFHHQKKLFEAAPSDTMVPELPTEMSQHFWVKSLRRLGHDVEVLRYTDAGIVAQKTVQRVSSQLRSVSDVGYKALRNLRQKLPLWIDVDRRVRNRQIIRTADSLEPDLTVIVGSYNELLPRTIRQIRRFTDGPFVATNGVGPHDWGRDTVDSEVAPWAYDVMFVNDRYRRDAWRSVGVNAVILPCLGCDVEYVDSVVSDDQTRSADVSFIGQPYPRRVEYLTALSELDIDLSIYGPRWQHTPLEPYHHGEVWGDDMWNVIYNSKIAINVHHRTQLTGGNMKLFEIPGARTMQIADTAGEGWFEQEDEIITIDTPTALREEVEYYLDADTEREEISIAGRRRVEADHTYDSRMAELVRLATGDSGREDGVVDSKILDQYRVIE